MIRIEAASGEGNLRVSMTALLCGDDLSVVFRGGDRHHIGAVAFASPRPSLADAAQCSASASVLCLSGHKDDLPARAAALRLAAAHGRNVSVSGGMHIDGADDAAIRWLEENFSQALTALDAALTEHFAKRRWSPIRHGAVGESERERMADNNGNEEKRDRAGGHAGALHVEPDLCR